MNGDRLNEFLGQLFGSKPGGVMPLLESAAAAPMSDQTRAMIRLAALQPGRDMLWHYRLHNLWTNLGRPALKPNPARQKILLLTDFTATQLVPILSLQSAARGIDAAIEVAQFDSVEQEVLNRSSRVYSSDYDIVVLCLSVHWLRRYLGQAALVARRDLQRAQEVVRSLLAALSAHGRAGILVGNFSGQVFPFPAGQVTTDESVGWNLAIADLNGWLARLAIARVHVVDLAAAVFYAGGHSALGTTNYLRARMAFEPAGAVAVARELAAAVAHTCGRTHRAVVTDWDNTLWGGEIAEAGSSGIECGNESPDGLGYRMVQEFLGGLKPLGILLAAVSRNDPAVRAAFAENEQLALSLEDFASVQVGFGAKSASVGRIAIDLGFGAEFMVLIDDSLFEIGEVIRAHPFIDVIRAGPEPESTLRALAGSGFFNTITLTGDDLHRSERAASLRSQRELRMSVSTAEEFLASIDIRLTVSPVNDENLQRVVQLFQKTNQFNLTTRRYTEADLERLMVEGATIGVFSYRDAFGPQGTISVVILCPDRDVVRVDSWLMSCRVLNRTVEEAVFSWIVGQARARRIVGEYRPTEKNGIVRDLYARLAFEPLGRDDETGSELWSSDHSADTSLRPLHFVRLDETLSV